MTVQAQQDARIAGLIDTIREKAAELEGLPPGACLAVGDRDAAYRHMREMYVLTEARIAAKQAVCLPMGTN